VSDETADLWRRLGHELLRRQLSADDLDALRGHIVAIAALLERSPTVARQASPEDLLSGRALRRQRLERGEPLHANSLVSGPANPHGLAATYCLEGDEAVARLEVGPAFEGAPGRAHGGVSALLLDDAMGHILAREEVLAFTVHLEVDYRTAIPTNTPLEVRARLREVAGRKITIEARVLVHGEVAATGVGLFLAVSPETFLSNLDTR
jgi:acyl-coenzyme A thioesterase PaaI-like protein